MIYREFNNIQILNCLGVSPVGLDTQLMTEKAAKIKIGRVLDIGTGTGFIPIYLSSLGYTCQGVDISEYAVSLAHRNSLINNTHCKFYCSDLFGNVRGKFDLITFNPPFGNTSSYKLTKVLEVVKSLIPKDNDLFIKLSFLVVGRTRRKLIKRFLHEVEEYLAKDGSVLIFLYPSETDLVAKYLHRVVGKYKNFSLVLLRF